MSWQSYHIVRNAVYRCCRAFGTAGPRGECPIGSGTELPNRGWTVADDPCDFHIIDDQYNYEQYIYLEFTTPSAFTAAWLSALMKTLCDFLGWGVGINSLDQGYIIVFANKLMVTGKRFEKCADVERLITNGRDAITVLGTE